MSLAYIIGRHEDDLICDFAETYHIFAYRSLPARFVATLAVGLRENSRVKMKMSDSEVTLGELLTARAVDVLEMLLWIKTKDGAKNRNRPKPVLDALFPKKKDDGNKVTSFRTVEDFENARNKILGSQGG